MIFVVTGITLLYNGGFLALKWAGPLLILKTSAGALVANEIHRCYAAWGSGESGDLRHGFVRVLELTATRVVDDTSSTRKTFKMMRVVPGNPSSLNVHGRDAMWRKAAINFSMDFTNLLGMTPYYFQASRVDFLDGRAGNRTWYWAKDAQIDTMVVDSTLERGKPNKSHVMVQIDTDFHLDMRRHISEHFGIHLLYTITPEKAASGEVDDLELDHGYFFDEEGRLHWFGAGGCHFTHTLWNYNTDHLTITQRDFFGLVTTYSVYLVDLRRCGPNRSLVLLTPLTQWTRKLTWKSSIADVCCPWWASKLIPGDRMELFNPVQTYWEKETDGPISFTRMTIIPSGGGFMTSTAVCGQFLEVTIPATKDDAIKNTSVTVKNRLQTPTCIKFDSTDLDMLERAARATVLHRYHRLAQKTTSKTQSAVYPADFQPTQVTVNLFSDEHPAKRRLTAFMRPLFDGAVELDADHANSARMVEERIVGPQTKHAKNPPVMSPFQLQCAREFAELVIPAKYAHTLEPLDIEQVLDRLNKPRQRAGIARAAVSPPSAHDILHKVFSKNEAAKDESKVQRPITQSPDDIKAEYSAYIYAIHDWMKENCPWYSPGQSNPEIADRIAMICTHARKHCVLSDYKMYDGTKSEPMRYLNYQIFCRGFAAPHLKRSLELGKRQHHNKACTTEGVKFNTENATQSGSSETTWSNTYGTGFVMYLTLRTMKNPKTDGFYTPSEAWEAMGCNFGDDALCADLDTEKYERAAKSLGLCLKCDVVKRDEGGVSFLNRQFGPEVWTGDPNSCCDILRQVRKFHVTATLPDNVTQWQKLLEKARSFKLSDANTPVIGEFVSRVLEIAQEEDETIFPPLWVSTPMAEHSGRRLKHPGPASENALAPMARWRSRDDDAQWPNQDCSGWMEAYAINGPLGQAGFSFDIFDEYLKTMTFDNCLSPPCCRAREVVDVKVPTIAGGELQIPETTEEEPAVEAGPDMKESAEGKTQDPTRHDTSNGSPKEGKASANPPGTDRPPTPPSRAERRKASRAQAAKVKANKPDPKDDVTAKAKAKPDSKSATQTEKPPPRTRGAKGNARAKAGVNRPRPVRK